MRVKLEDLIIKYEINLSELRNDVSYMPSVKKLGRILQLVTVINDLNKLLSVPKHEAPKVIINKEAKEVCDKEHINTVNRMFTCDGCGNINCTCKPIG